LHLKQILRFWAKNHLYTGFGIPFEPEGIAQYDSCGMYSYYRLFYRGMVGKGAASGKTVIKIILLGVAAIGLGYLWNMIFPINKPLWTSSYVLFTAGIAMTVLL